jgi:uncharacterized protein (TIGR03066 family)
MNQVRLALAGALVLGLAVAARAGKEGPKPGKDDLQKKLIGKWKVVKGNDVPRRATIEFTRDGKLILLFERDGKEVKAQADYKVEGKGFTLTRTVMGEERTDKIEVVTAEDDRLVLKRMKGEELELKRVKAKKG